MYTEEQKKELRKECEKYGLTEEETARVLSGRYEPWNYYDGEYEFDENGNFIVLSGPKTKPKRRGTKKNSID